MENPHSDMKSLCRRVVRQAETADAAEMSSFAPTAISIRSSHFDFTANLLRKMEKTDATNIDMAVTRNISTLMFLPERL